jgi:DNA-binding GntR family transcriptional regulator
MVILAKGMNSMGTIVGPRRATLAGEVRAEIERMIVDGDLAAGEKMNELALSNIMGVSRGTVREAIRLLAHSGLIDLIANRGAFVHETTLTEVRNLYDLRGAVFAMACSSAAVRVADGTEVDLPRRLTQNLEKMRATLASEDTVNYYKLNIEFHDMLLAGAGNPKAKMIYDNLVREMHLFRRRGLSIVTNLARSLEEHIVISDAVIAGEREAARAAAYAHITAGLLRYMKMLD